jgi:hypothetical protein
MYAIIESLYLRIAAMAVVVELLYEKGWPETPEEFD